MTDPRLETMPESVRQLIDATMKLWSGCVPFPNESGQIVLAHSRAALERLYLCGYSEGADRGWDNAREVVGEFMGRAEVVAS